MRSILKTLQPILFCGLMLNFVPPAPAQIGITNVDSYTVFRTGTNEPLLTLSLTNSFPDFGIQPTISFEFGFTTAETNALDTFFDSFFLTLQSPDQSAVVFSADRTGVAWAPTTPGNLDLSTNAMRINPVAFPTNSFLNLSPSPSVRFAYNVSLFLPGPLSRSPLSLFFDFFDNLNGIASTAYVIGLRLDATGSLGTKARFYRLNSTVRTRIDSIQETNSCILLAYHFEPHLLQLQSSPMGTNNFTPVTNAVLRSNEQLFVVPCPNDNRTFSILSDTNATIVNVSVSGMFLIVEFDFGTDVAPVQVESALSVASRTNASSLFFERPSTRVESRRKLGVPIPGYVLPPP